MTGWDAHLLTDLPDGPLSEVLPVYQRVATARWPRLAEARAALAQVRTRPVRVADRDVVLQWNPARATSSTAKVDAASIQQRACFLCPASFPPEEVGIPFGADWVILPNPAPILADHLVIAHREHRLQRVEDAIPGLLDFAVASGMTALYNGPRCGASAPDHLHLQAVASGQLPEELLVLLPLPRIGGEGRGEGGRHSLSSVERPGELSPPLSMSQTQAAEPWGELPESSPSGPEFSECPQGARAWRATGAGREILGVSGSRPAVERALRDAIAALAVDEPGPDEPRVNLLVRPSADGIAALLFPRGAHRPAAFSAEGPDQRVISPGVIDMAGVVVAVREADFDALTDEEIAGIFREVTLPPDRADAWFASLSRRWADG